jgi:transcriptional regulator with XRE-family HTH domain
MVIIEWTPAEIRALREAMRRSPLEFARIVGVTKRTLSLWESGQTSNMHESSKRLLYQVLEDAADDAKQRFGPLPQTIPAPRLRMRRATGAFYSRRPMNQRHYWHGRKRQTWVR